MRNLLTTSLVALLCTACQSTPTPAPGSTTNPGNGSAWTCSPRVTLSSLWTFLAKKYDYNNDGRISASEYDRGEKRFRNYDRNEDGKLTKADVPPDTFFNGFSHMLVRQADSDRNSEITTAEWTAFGDRLDQDSDGSLTPSEVAATMGSWAEDWPLFLLSFDQDSDGDFDSTDLAITFRDQDFDGNGTLTGKETRGWAPTAERPTNRPPAVGETAPLFVLPHADNASRSFDLAAAIGPKPIALVFGSYT